VLSNILYKTTIEFKDDLSLDIIEKHTKVIEELHNNRCGWVRNNSTNPFILNFEGGADSFPILSLAFLDIMKYSHIIDTFKRWDWVDIKNPSETNNIKEEYPRLKERFDRHYGRKQV